MIRRHWFSRPVDWQVVNLQKRLDLQVADNTCVTEALLDAEAEIRRLQQELDDTRVDHANAVRQVDCLAGEKRRLTDALIAERTKGAAFADIVTTSLNDLAGGAQ